MITCAKQNFENVSKKCLQNYLIFIKAKSNIECYKLKFSKLHVGCLKHRRNYILLNKMDPNCIATGPKCSARAPETQSLSTSSPAAVAAAMDPKPVLTSEPAWSKLKEYYNQQGKNIVIKEQFAKDGSRFNKFRYGQYVF